MLITREYKDANNEGVLNLEVGQLVLGVDVICIGMIITREHSDANKTEYLEC